MSLAWYVDVFALHALETRFEDGLCRPLAPPPPCHSSLKTTEPGVGIERVLAGGDDGSVADSFGDLDLGPHGFTVLIDATWVHHPPPETQTSGLPGGWSIVRDPGLLAEWNQAHDY